MSNPERRSNKDFRFHFMDLPGELRNMIYLYAAVDDDDNDDNVDFLLPSICALSRQIRKEALPICLASRPPSLHVDSAVHWDDEHGLPSVKCKVYPKIMEEYMNWIRTFRINFVVEQTTIFCFIINSKFDSDVVCSYEIQVMKRPDSDEYLQWRETLTTTWVPIFKNSTKSVLDSIVERKQSVLCPTNIREVTDALCKT